MQVRVPNASPCGLVANFETRCADYFHPSVLAYVLRNRAAHLARHARGAAALTQRVREELWQIGAASVSSSCHLEPQTTATLLLSLAKLGETLPDAVKALTAGFKFERAQPKAVALTLNAFARHPRGLRHVDSEFWPGIAETIEQKEQYFMPQDAAACALAITGILAANRGGNTGAGSTGALIDQSASQRLKACYLRVLRYAENMLRELDAHSFKARDLSCILQAVYASRVEAPGLVIAALQRLRELIPASLNGIDDCIYVLDLLPPPTFAAGTVEERRVKRDVARAEKAFVEWGFEYLRDHLDCLRVRELARVAAVCNRLRSWSSDEFALRFAAAWEAALRDSGEMRPQYLSHGACYFLRRYEASVSRELGARGEAEQQRIARVSDACARIGEMLHDHARSRYSAEDLRRVEEVLHIAEQCRAKRTGKQAPRQF
ncbi:DEAD/DEAH box helicase [Babesia caballi]|uniref:DEAD/DEAH box helicase n=1 Tax=Babesia caballi TaxID=5871 RepID=A0AAV4LQH5_BABCB|nr:DEAD/DEAH box helicase [Babesia caballi]